MMNIIIPIWQWVIENRFEIEKIWRYMKYENAHLD